MNESHCLAWNYYPVIWLLTCIAIIWLTRIAISGISGIIVRLLMLLGLGLNATVTFANGNVMPVVGMPQGFKAASALWIPASKSHHLLLLADQSSLLYYSVGDIILRVGALILLLCWLKKVLPHYYKRRKNYAA